MVGKKASADGSVITSHTCDGKYRTSLYVRPAADWPADTVEAVCRGRYLTDRADDRSPLVEAGRIPQARHTFRFLDTAYPCINERQLAFGETTISGRPELQNGKGMFTIEELQRVALERCATAREAIKLMGRLVEKYGYGDSGECLTVADPREVWHFEIFGEGPDKVGGVWAAVRIPDDHVGVSANISRIAEIDRADTLNCLASKNVEKVARRMGLWDGKKPFSFWRAYGTNYAHPDEAKSFDIREYFILNALAPSLNLSYEAEELPISVKPDTLVSVSDVLALFRQTYAGTDYDPVRDLKVTVEKDSVTDTIVSPRANPWMRPDEKKLMQTLAGEGVCHHRPVAVAFCGYATVVQLRDWLPDDVGGVVWLGLDNPAQSPRIPVYCGVAELPDALGRNGNNNYDDCSAVWKFRAANKLGALNWGKNAERFNKGIKHFEQKGLEEMPMVEARYQEILAVQGQDAARQYLSDYTADFAGAAMSRWEELARKLWMEGRFGL